MAGGYEEVLVLVQVLVLYKSLKVGFGPLLSVPHSSHLCKRTNNIMVLLTTCSWR